MYWQLFQFISQRTLLWSVSYALSTPHVYVLHVNVFSKVKINPLNTELNPICQ